MKLAYNSLTQIKDDLPDINGFVHDDSDLSHATPHQVLAEDDSRLKVQSHHLHELDDPMLLNVFHGLPKYGVVHELEEALLKVFGHPGSKLGVEVDLLH